MLIYEDLIEQLMNTKKQLGVHTTPDTLPITSPNSI